MPAQKFGLLYHYHCLAPKIVYQADVTNDINEQRKFDLGVSNIPFREYFQSNTKELKNVIYRNDIELSKYIWQLKGTGLTPNVTWTIAAKIYSKTRISFCKFCCTEKLFIINSFDKNQLLNKKNELVITCRYKNYQLRV